MSKKEKRDPAVGELTREIQTGLRELSARLHSVNQAVGVHLELQAVDLAVLDMVSRKGPLSPRDLTAAVGIHPATLTGVLDRLEQGGWAIRASDPSDRRKVRIEVRDQRAGELLKLYAPMNRSIAQLCADYTPDELEAIRDFIRRLATAGSDAVATLRANH